MAADSKSDLPQGTLDLLILTIVATVADAAMLSAWRPARQAARIDPLAVLRDG